MGKSQVNEMKLGAFIRGYKAFFILALFRTTIRENIALGKSDLGSASLEEVHEAARKANAYEFIMSMHINKHPNPDFG